MSEYGWVLLYSGFVPFCASFIPWFRIWQRLNALACTLGGITVIFGLWDYAAVMRDHWYFNPEAVGPIRFMRLPLEEILFFIVIPFCCIVTWESVLFVSKRIIPRAKS